MLTLLAFLVLSMIRMVATADAAVINVSPGAGTLQAAVDAASPGDQLRLVVGTYTGAVTIDKPLQIVGPKYVASGPQSARIDAECGAATALSIESDDVYVKRVSVSGGTLYTIDINGRARVRLNTVTPIEDFFGCGAVEYGINVFNSTAVRIEKCTVIGDNNGYTGSVGYHDAGIYIGGIPDGAGVRVKKGHVVGNNRGIIVEDSADAPGGALGVRVQKVGMPSNATGIFIHNSDGVRIDRNTVNDARGSDPDVSIEVDGTSDNNLIKANTFVEATTDVIDDGFSNCWIGNTVGTGTVPSGGCDD